MLVYQILASIMHKKIKKKKSYKNNTLKISAPIWNKKFELSDELYSAPDIQNYLENIFKKKDQSLIIFQ